VKTLREYQKEAVLALANGGLNASGLGAGKTLISVEAARHLGRQPRILVVAPVTTLCQWHDTFVEQYPSLGAKGLVHICGTHRKDLETWDLMKKKRPGVFIMSWNAMHGGVPESIRRQASVGRNALAAQPKVTMTAVRKAISEGTVPPWTRTGTWDLVILDEVHRACNRHGVPYHVIKLINANQKHGLSATPGGNHPERFWAVLSLLWPDRYKGFWNWAEEHFHVSEEGIRTARGKETLVRKIGRERKPGGTWDDIPAVVRYRTEDVCDQLPPVIERVVTVGMAPEQEEQYRDFEEQSLAWLSEQPVATPLPLSQRLRLRQAAHGTLKAEEVQRRTFTTVRERDLQQFLRTAAAPKIHRPRGWTPYPCDVEKGPVRFGAEVPAATLNAAQGGRLNSFAHKGLHRSGLRKSPGIRRNKTGMEEVRVSHCVEVLEIGFEERAAQIKLDAVRDILSDLPEGEPLLVWTSSAKWARMAEAALGKQAASWTMKTTAAKRKRIERGFGTEWRVLFAQIQSLSEGVDWLKDACRCEVIASPTEDEVMNEQAEGRLHRPGQKSPVQRWRLVTEGTIDEDVNLSNMEKRARMGSLYKDDQRKGKT
jgi:superfamily II DNA or RNA helicase